MPDRAPAAQLVQLIQRKPLVLNEEPSLHSYSVEQGCCQTQHTLALLRGAPLKVCAHIVLSLAASLREVGSVLSRCSVQDEEQLCCVRGLLGNFMDRCTAWCCVQGRLHGEPGKLTARGLHVARTEARCYTQTVDAASRTTTLPSSPSG